MQAYVALGTPSLFLGSLGLAYEHFTQGSRLYDPHRHHPLVAVYGLDPGVFCGSYTAFSLFCLGYPDQARHRSEEALALARSLAHPYTTAFALTWAAEAAAARECAEALVTLAQEQEFPYWLGFGLLFQGWALAVQGQGAAGCEQIRQSLKVLQATGTIVGLRSGATLLAEAYGKSGEVEEGLATVTEVLHTLDQPGERLWDAELYRLKGELTLARSRVQTNHKAKSKGQKATLPNPQGQVEAEACFQQAIEIACRQGAKSWELRAATSLARLWQRQGKKAKARALLAPVYN